MRHGGVKRGLSPVFMSKWSDIAYVLDPFVDIKLDGFCAQAYLNGTAYLSSEMYVSIWVPLNSDRCLLFQF